MSSNSQDCRRVGARACGPTKWRRRYSVVIAAHKLRKSAVRHCRSALTSARTFPHALQPSRLMEEQLRSILRKLVGRLDHRMIALMARRSPAMTTGEGRIAGGDNWKSLFSIR